MNIQINNLQDAKITGPAVDNTGAVIEEQHIHVKFNQQILRKVKIFSINRIVEINEEALIMSEYDKSSEFSKGTVNHLGCKIDIEKINIGKLNTEKLKMELNIMKEYRATYSDYSSTLGCIISENDIQTK